MTFLKLEKTVYASNQKLWREGKGLRDLAGILLRRNFIINAVKRNY